MCLTSWKRKRMNVWLRVRDTMSPCNLREGNVKRKLSKTISSDAKPIWWNETIFWLDFQFLIKKKFCILTIYEWWNHIIIKIQWIDGSNRVYKCVHLDWLNDILKMTKLRWLPYKKIFIRKSTSTAFEPRLQTKTIDEQKIISLRFVRSKSYSTSLERRIIK